jgi:glycosyltransferase involved in cell wall biosynthesis
MERELRSSVGELPVEFPGWRDPLPYLQGADVVLSTSRSESWGASIVEALAAGVPVVAPDVGIAREAGAIVAELNGMPEKIVDVLQQGTRGILRLKHSEATEWASRWRNTLA